MRTRRKTGFTLVEILIVVVILGILAAIVIPQFTSASQEAVKGALLSQLQTIESQFELYRVRNQGTAPDLGGDSNGGWGALVSAQYLKEQPYNGYTKSSAIAVGDANIDAGAPEAGTSGWGYRAVADGVPTAVIFAMGFDHLNNVLSNEDGYSTAIEVEIDEEEPVDP